MSEECDWDIDKYKTDYESDEHWELKRNFIDQNRSNHTEDEIICLAQVFFNIEMLGCKYDSQVMLKIAEMSKGIIEKYRESRKTRLKRTFVGGGQAAKNKVQRK